MRIWRNNSISRYNYNMSKRQWLMVTGVIVIILPFSGFPSSWNTSVSVILGLLIITIAYNLNSEKSPKISAPSHMPFVEHKSVTISYASGEIGKNISEPINIKSKDDQTDSNIISKKDTVVDQ